MGRDITCKIQQSPRKRTLSSILPSVHAAPSPPGVLAALARGYDRASADALAVFAVMVSVVLAVWGHLFDFTTPDWLFLGIWAAMTAILCWRVRAARDVPRALVGLLGGLAIEAWGTVTDLWTYDTHERPPLWIVPAWPVATLAIDRLAALALLALPRRAERVTLPLLAAFVAWMAWFARPSWGSPVTWAALAAMVLVVAIRGDRRLDLALFVAGTALGVFLEYWGTSRECWTYWTREVPPPIAAVAHGFASVAFQRVIDVASLLTRALRPSPVRAKSAVRAGSSRFRR